MLTEKMALVGRLCYNKQNARFLETNYGKSIEKFEKVQGEK